MGRNLIFLIFWFDEFLPKDHLNNIPKYGGKICLNYISIPILNCYYNQQYFLNKKMAVI